MRDGIVQECLEKTYDGGCHENPAEAMRKKAVNGNSEILLERMPASYEHGKNN